jgi:hypothetical protein
MLQKNTGILLSIILVVLMAVLALPALAETQQNNSTNSMAQLGNVSNATVTLYYYDNSTNEKGIMVPMSDNPQQVAWDASRSAPGMYTFSQVPTDRWYYLEADNNGHKWYAVFYMAQGEGTHTANVDIPPFQPLNDSIVSITPAPAVEPTAVPNTSVNIPTPTALKPEPTPAPAGIFSIVALMAAVLLLSKKQ